MDETLYYMAQCDALNERITKLEQSLSDAKSANRELMEFLAALLSDSEGDYDFIMYQIEEELARHSVQKATSNEPK